MQSEIKDEVSFPVYPELWLLRRWKWIQNLLIECTARRGSTCVPALHLLWWVVLCAHRMQMVFISAFAYLGSLCALHTTDSTHRFRWQTKREKGKPVRNGSLPQHFSKWKFHIRNHWQTNQYNCLCFFPLFPGSVVLCCVSLIGCASTGARSLYILGSLVLLLLCVRTRTINPIVHTFE